MVHYVIKVQNVYYMLSYAFSVLQQKGYRKIAVEPFEHTADLFAAILNKGLSNQIRQGLKKSYTEKRNKLRTPVGKVNVSHSIKQQTLLKKQLICEYDVLTENIYVNQILKTTGILLLRSAEVENQRKKALKKVMLFLKDVDTIDPQCIQWSNLKCQRLNPTYEMLTNISNLVINGLLLTEQDGTHKLAKYVDYQYMHRLYERFVLNYYRKHFPAFKVSAAQIDWDVDDGMDALLPLMKSDVTIEYKGKTLIIDTKYYSQVLQTNRLYQSKSLHSSNLYQIFTYVKNRDTGHTGNVSGLLLYAKTDETTMPDNDYILSGNRISVRTLDLNMDFSDIEEQLNSIINKFFSI